MPAMPEEPPARRLHSLDALRGFDIVLMLLVNMSWDRDVFPGQLFHVPWNAPAQGAALADLVFPWFVFIAGASVPLSMRAGRGRSRPASRRLLDALRRAAVLYLCGVLLTVAGSATESPLTWKHLFSWNILQLIAASYFVCVCAGFASLRARLVLCVVLLTSKLALHVGLSADSVRATLDAAGLAARGEFQGAGTFTHLDDVKRLLQLEHVKQGGAGVSTYVLGWLGMFAQQALPLASVGIAGGLFTELLTSERSDADRLRRAALVAAGVLALAFLLQLGYSPQGGGLLGPLTLPFSKWIFTPAYCLLVIGTGGLLYVAFHHAIDVRRVVGTGPLGALGKNALLVYVGAELSFKLVFSKWQILHPNGHSGALAGGFMAWVAHWTGSSAAGAWAWVIAWLVLWWAVARRLDRKGLYWRA